MALPTPDNLFGRLRPRVPLPPAILRGLAGMGLLAGVTTIALHHPWIGGGLLVVALLAAGLEQANRSLSLGVLAVPFGFAMADPSRALAAMFLTFALAVFLVLRGDRANVPPVMLGAAAALLLACVLPDHFSLLSYLIGIACFVAAGQGMAKRGA